ISAARIRNPSSPVIAVMQPAHALLANHCTVFQRACPASRRLLVQPQVRSVVVIIGNVLGEESLHGSQSWPRLLALKDGELLAKGEVFEQQTAARPKPAKHGSEPEPEQVKHGNQVIADRLCRLPDEVVDFTAGQDCDEGQTTPQPSFAFLRERILKTRG